MILCMRSPWGSAFPLSGQAALYCQRLPEAEQAVTRVAGHEQGNVQLVTVRELASRLTGADRDGCVVVDCRFNLLQPEAGRALYLAGHIPGAQYADLDRDLSGPRRPDSGRHPLPDPEQLRQLLGGFGIGPHTLVVAYDDASGGLAARVWWLLRWMGHRQVALLDGGFAAWQAAGLPVTGEVPDTRAVRFTGQPGQMPTLDTPQVSAALAAGRIRLLDLRADERFQGLVEPIDPVAGHVPGAISAPFAGNLGADGRFQSPEALASRYATLAGDRPPGEVVCMCGSGVTACHGIFALELAGRPGATLYPGSWSEWIRSPDRPVATGR